jgi:hypothetical protein
MQLDRLTAESVIMPFNCGDDDLNAFLMNDAKAFMQKKLLLMPTFRPFLSMKRMISGYW